MTSGGGKIEIIYYFWLSVKYNIFLSQFRIVFPHARNNIIHQPVFGARKASKNDKISLKKITIIPLSSRISKTHNHDYNNK